MGPLGPSSELYGTTRAELRAVWDHADACVALGQAESPPQYPATHCSDSK